jgi:hypothetical protein
MNMKKLAGVLPKNSPETEPYKEPARPRRFEAEEASDGTFIIHCYGGKAHDYMGEKKTAKNAKEVMEKFESFFSGKKEKAEKKEE